MSDTSLEHGSKEILEIEVMTAFFERTWWNDYRVHLEAQFQDEVLSRATEITQL